jgi:hypothetical protein
MKVFEKYKQYGFLNFCERSLLSVLSHIGIRIDKWLVCVQTIDIKKLDSTQIVDEKYTVREMNFKDFKNSKVLSSIKLESIKKRLSNKSFIAYGVFDNQILAYYCWLSLNEFEFSNNLYTMNLRSNQGLLFDAYCQPKYRGRGLHNYMNIYRLKSLYEFGKDEAVVILLKQNIPARKSQKKAGFHCRMSITTYKIFGKKGVITSLNKINL